MRYLPGVWLPTRPFFGAFFGKWVRHDQFTREIWAQPLVFPRVRAKVGRDLSLCSSRNYYNHPVRLEASTSHLLPRTPSEGGPMSGGKPRDQLGPLAHDE